MYHVVYDNDHVDTLKMARMIWKLSRLPVTGTRFATSSHENHPGYSDELSFLCRCWAWRNAAISPHVGSEWREIWEWTDFDRIPCLTSWDCRLHISARCHLHLGTAWWHVTVLWRFPAPQKAPQYGWFISWKMPLKIDDGVTPISGNLQISSSDVTWFAELS